MTLHDLQELDDNLGAWADQNLALAGLLGVVDGIERIVEDGGLDHFGGWLRFSNGEFVRYEVSAYAKTMLAFRSHERKECPSVQRPRGFFSSSAARGEAVSSALIAQ